MKGAVVRLVLVTGLFLAWLGYLAYLVTVTPRDPVILCRPQFLVSELDVIAQVASLDRPVVVEEVLYPAETVDLIGKELHVSNLALCAPPAHLQKIPGQRDFTAPGSYILALRKLETTAGAPASYEVVPTPPAPGYPSPGPPRPGPPRIYPATPEALAQWRQLAKP